jgi:hypothetical protein
MSLLDSTDSKRKSIHDGVGGHELNTGDYTALDRVGALIMVQLAGPEPTG